MSVTRFQIEITTKNGTTITQYKSEKEANDQMDIYERLRKRGEFRAHVELIRVEKTHVLRTLTERPY